MSVMISVILGLGFALFGLFAVHVIVATSRAAAPGLAQLRADMRAPQTSEIRTTLIERALVRLRANRGPLRHRHRPKPVMHRLNGRKARPAAA